PTSDVHPLSLHDALPILFTSTRPRDSRSPTRRLTSASTVESSVLVRRCMSRKRLLTVLRSTAALKPSPCAVPRPKPVIDFIGWRSEEHTSELQSPYDLVC